MPTIKRIEKLQIDIALDKAVESLLYDAFPASQKQVVILGHKINELIDAVNTLSEKGEK